MSCRGCPHSKLGDAIRALRQAGYAVLRETRGCRGCVAEKAALVIAKAAGATQLVFAAGPGVADNAVPGSVVLWVHGPGDCAAAIVAAAVFVGLCAQRAGPGTITVYVAP